MVYVDQTATIGLQETDLSITLKDKRPCKNRTYYELDGFIYLSAIKKNKCIIFIDLRSTDINENISHLLPWLYTENINNKHVCFLALSAENYIKYHL